MTETQFEKDLKEAFSSHAARMPADATERLRRFDYRPRTGHVPPRLTGGVVAALTVTAGATIAVVTIGGSPPAFAGWSPTPARATETAASPGSGCQAQVASLRVLPGAGAATTWTVVATDVRGPFTLTVYADGSGSGSASCFTGPSFSIVSRTAGGAQGAAASVSGSSSGAGRGQSSGSVMVGGDGTGGVEHLSVGHFASSSQGAYTVVEGQIEPGVTGVTLNRTSGEAVVASTGDGWFAAWWPGSEGVTSAQIETAAGEATEPLTTPSTPSPPAAGTGAVSTR